MNPNMARILVLLFDHPGWVQIKWMARKLGRRVIIRDLCKLKRLGLVISHPTNEALYLSSGWKLSANGRRVVAAITGAAYSTNLLVHSEC